MRRRFLFLLAAPALAVAAAAPAVAATPTASYQLFNSDSWFSVTVNSNPSNYGVRAELQCIFSGGQRQYNYGGWVYSSGAVSTATSSCTSLGGQPVAGYFQYRKSNPIRVTCWIPGDNRAGSC